MPASAYKAVLKVYDGSTLLTTMEVVKSAPTSTASIQLPTGKTYRIEAEALSVGGTVLARGTVEHQLTGNATVQVPLRSLFYSAELTLSRELPSGREYVLTVKAPDGSPVPLDDFEVTYTSSGGEIVTQSKLGVVTRNVPGTTNILTATITGPAVTKTVTTSRIAYAGVTTITGQGSPLVGYDRRLQISGVTTGGQPVSGTANPDGTYQINLPDVQSELISGGIYGLRTSPPVQYTQVDSLNLVDETGNLVGTVETSERGFSFNELTFVDGATTVSSDPRQIHYQWSYPLQAGWNVVLNSYGVPAARPLTNGYPFTFNIRTGNASISQSADTLTPVEGGTVTHTVKVKAPSSQGFTIALPPSLRLQGSFSGAACTGPVVESMNSVYTCSVPTTATTETTVTFKTTAQSLATEPANPSQLRVRVLRASYVDTNPADDTSTLEFTRLAAAAPGSLNMMVDLQSPTLTVSPIGSVTAGTPTTLSGTVSDNVSLTKVDVFDGVRPLGSASLDSTVTANWSYQWTPDSTGNTTLRVVAHDTSGNTTKMDVPVTVK